MENNYSHKLVLYNDDKHDFLYVIACLIRCCKHDPIQAEQCAVITHSKGKCAVKGGVFLELLDIKNDLEELDLTTEIEIYESYMH